MDEFDLASVALSSFVALQVAAFVAWIRGRRPKEKERKAMAELMRQVNAFNGLDQMAATLAAASISNGDQAHTLCAAKAIAVQNVLRQASILDELEVDRNRRVESYRYPRWRLYLLWYPYRGLTEALLRYQAAVSVILLLSSPIWLIYILNSKSETAVKITEAPLATLIFSTLILVGMNIIWYAATVLLEKRRCRVEL